MLVSERRRKMEDTKQRILEKSLELFSTKGYDAVSVGEIAKAVGIKAPSLYNHFPSKQAIFDAILETTSAHYQKDTAEISVHVQDSQKDIPVFSHISEEILVEKVRQIFLYSLHDKTISQFRRMMTLEQFRSPPICRTAFQTLCGLDDFLPCRHLPCAGCKRRTAERRP